MAPSWPLFASLLLALPSLGPAVCFWTGTLHTGQYFLCTGTPTGGLLTFTIGQKHQENRRLRVTADCSVSNKPMLSRARVIVGFGERFRGAMVRGGEDLICDGLDKQPGLYLTVITGNPELDGQTVGCSLNVREEMPQTNTSHVLEQHAENQGPRALLLPFTVADDRSTVLNVTGSEDLPILRLHIMRQNHSCVQELAKQQGCFPALQLAQCAVRHAAKDEGRYAMRLTFTKNATVTLGPDKKGRWYALLSCSDAWACRNSTLPTVSMKLAQRDTARPLALGAAFMVAMPLFALFVVALLRVLLNRCTGWIERAEPKERLGWSGTVAGLAELASRGVQEVVFDKRPWQLAKGLLLMALAFFSSTTQFVISRWWDMQESGDRDLCWYNEACYLPLWGLDLPVNKMLSHLPYFCCSGGLFLSVLYGELKCRRHARPGLPAPDLSIFYALALSVGLEGLGSMCYHLCPALEVFQFDTAFMIPIAHFSMFALAGVSNNNNARPQAFSGMGTSVSAGRYIEEEESRGVPTPYQYFAFCVCPLWLLSFVGTGYDVHSAPAQGKRYYAFALAMLLWSWKVIGWLSHLLPPGVPAYLCPALCLLLRCTMVVALTCSDLRRRHMGGFANLLLVLSIATMFLVTVAQIAVLDGRTAAAGDTRRKRLARMAIRYAFEALCFVAGNLAMRAFTARATDVLGTAHMSRSMNLPCMQLGRFHTPFDTHDLWHLLSAITLQLWVMCLLNTRLRVWKSQAACNGS